MEGKYRQTSEKKENLHELSGSINAGYVKEKEGK